MKIKTTELTGPALDWAVAQCEGEDYSPVITYSGIGTEYPATNYSSSWDMAGPLIDREGISVIRCDDVYGQDALGFCNNVRIPVWGATTGQHPIEYTIVGKKVYLDDVVYGPTALICAMRCFVSIKLGLVVDVPDGLLAAA